MANDAKDEDLLGLTASIVAAHVSNNAVEAADLPALIREVYASLARVGAEGGAGPATRAPAVPVEESITPNHLICLEDGKKLTMLKRHLRSAYSMSPEDYREKWGLPSDYPMVAPNYSRQRSRLAKEIGLGKAAGKGQASRRRK